MRSLRKVDSGTMLASLTIHLFPVEKAILPPTMGYYIHAAFLDIARQVDSRIAEQLHMDQPYKPFTVSPLQGKFSKQGKGRISIHAGTECWLRFTIMDDHLLSTISDFFLEGDSSLLRLGDSMFQITRVTSNGNGANEQWSGCSTFEEILDCASGFSKLGIRFYSPTAFKVHDRNTRSTYSHVFPDPLHCFQSWLRKWNALAPIPFDEDSLLCFIQKHIRFSRYSIRTKIMNFGSYKQLGFVGNCEYQFINSVSKDASDGLDGKPEEFLRQAEALANFAFYCGTGYKTTMGMGQTRRQKLVRANGL